MARVLVIEPDPALRLALASNLAEAGHAVDVVAHADGCTSMVRGSGAEVVLLGLERPQVQEACRQLRADAQTRRTLLFVLSAGSAEIDRVLAFEAGADDYLAKPPSLREVVLRVRALLRRRGSVPTSDGIDLGRVHIDRAARRVLLDGAAVELTVREFDLLLRLAERKGRVQTREALVAELWPEEIHSPRVVDTTVKRLRKKLGVGADCIQTIRGVGYRLAALIDNDETTPKHGLGSIG